MQAVSQPSAEKRITLPPCPRCRGRLVLEHRLMVGLTTEPILACMSCGGELRLEGGKWVPPVSAIRSVVVQVEKKPRINYRRIEACPSCGKEVRTDRMAAHKRTHLGRRQA